MTAISKVDLLALTDSLGIQALALEELASSTPAGELQDAAEANLTRILALTDSKQVVALTDSFDKLNDASANPQKAASDLFSGVIKALNIHTGGLNAYLSAQSGRVSSSFAALFRSIMGATNLSPVNVFLDSVISLATFAVTGATTGTFAAAGAIDTTQVSATACEVEVTTLIGAGAVTATLTMVKADNTTETKVVNIGSGDTAGTKYDIGTSANLYKDCSAIAITGGTTGAFKVQNKVERVPSA